MNIEFSIAPDLWGVAAKPYRAQKALPEWWKKLQRTADRPGFPTDTIKACVPVSDMLTAGYIIPMPFDLHVESHKGQVPVFSWRFAPDNFVQFHDIEQVPIYGGAWKLLNPWAIRTSPGVSVMITQPSHRPELLFHTLEAIVDTDVFEPTVNFPFIWPDINYNGVIEAGTPFAQVIPFRREPCTMTVHSATDTAIKDQDRARNAVLSQRGSYRRRYHQSKSYGEEVLAP